MEVNASRLVGPADLQANSLKHSTQDVALPKMVALYAVWYNYAKQHKSLKGLSPAMAAGIGPTLWSMTDLAEVITRACRNLARAGRMKGGWSYEKASSGTRRPHRTGHRWSVYWFSGRSEGSRRTDRQSGRSDIWPRHPDGLGTQADRIGARKRKLRHDLDRPSWFRYPLARAPFAHKHAPAARIALRGFGQRGDAIGAEVTKVLAHLAPGGQHTHVIEEAESDRPNLPVGVASFRINIIEHELMLGSNGAADWRKIDRLCDELAPRPNQQSICIDRVT